MQTEFRGRAYKVHTERVQQSNPNPDWLKGSPYLLSVVLLLQFEERAGKVQNNGRQKKMQWHQHFDQNFHFLPCEQLVSLKNNQNTNDTSRKNRKIKILSIIVLFFDCMLFKRVLFQNKVNQTWLLTGNSSAMKICSLFTEQTLAQKSQRHIF